MDIKHDPMEFNNLIKCEVCGGPNFADDYGNSDKCPRCGWIQCNHNELEEKWHGISYPMLVPLSRAREQYKAGQKFKATFEDFINGFKFYGEMLFWYKGKCYSMFGEGEKVLIVTKESEQVYATLDEFRDRASIDGRLLKDIWDEVVHPCFMYCGGEHDYDFPPD